MAYIHTIEVGQPIKVGPYQITATGTSVGEHPTIELQSDGPNGQDTAVIDRATWYRPEKGDTAPNSPQYRRIETLIHIGVKKDGEIRREAAELCIEAPESVPIDVPDT